MMNDEFPQPLRRLCRFSRQILSAGFPAANDEFPQPLRRLCRFSRQIYLPGSLLRTMNFRSR
jgi:hypothetical protein